MDEKLMQELIIKFPEEVLDEEGLTFVEREVATGTCRLNVVLRDRRGRHVLVEAQVGGLDTKHIDRHIDFVEGFMADNPGADVRVIYVANSVDPLRKQFLERRGYEHKEVPLQKLLQIAERHAIREETQTPPAALHSEGKQGFHGVVPPQEEAKRESFLRHVNTEREKSFWTRFFVEVDARRPWLKATFQAAEFGVHVHNRRHFKSSNGKYSLMYTRGGLLAMNSVTTQGMYFRNGLERMKNWCTSPELPERFYGELQKRALLRGMSEIDVRNLVAGKDQAGIEKVITDLFCCLDMFR